MSPFNSFTRANHLTCHILYLFKQSLHLHIVEGPIQHHAGSVEGICSQWHNFLLVWVSAKHHFPKVHVVCLVVVAVCVVDIRGTHLKKEEWGE